MGLIFSYGAIIQGIVWAFSGFEENLSRNYFFLALFAIVAIMYGIGFGVLLLLKKRRGSDV